MEFFENDLFEDMSELAYSNENENENNEAPPPPPPPPPAIANPDAEEPEEMPPELIRGDKEHDRYYDVVGTC